LVAVSDLHERTEVAVEGGSANLAGVSEHVNPVGALKVNATSSAKLLRPLTVTVEVPADPTFTDDGETVEAVMVKSTMLKTM
jgi:hypothetical protein